MSEADVRAAAAFMVAWGNAMTETPEEREAFFGNLGALLHADSASFVHRLVGKRLKEEE